MCLYMFVYRKCLSINCLFSDVTLIACPSVSCLLPHLVIVALIIISIVCICICICFNIIDIM